MHFSPEFLVGATFRQEWLGLMRAFTQNWATTKEGVGFLWPERFVIFPKRLYSATMLQPRGIF
jgi:hypothetical protein